MQFKKWIKLEEATAMGDSLPIINNIQRTKIHQLKKQESLETLL